MNKPIRLLYVEDNAQDADMTRVHFELEAPDFKLETVTSGEACFAILNKKEFDLLLLDNRLPDMDGIDIITELRKAGYTLPIVLATGVGDEETVAKALRAGAIDYVSKSDKDYLFALPELFRQLLTREQKNVLNIIKQSTHQILYVEPNTMDAELTMQFFATDAPHLQMHTVASSREALALLTSKQDVDLVLTDLRIPDMDALELMLEMKHLNINIPFIVTTGKGDEVAAATALRLGAYDYIVKRDDYISQLPHAIDNALQRANLDQMTRRLNDELATLNASLEKKVKSRTADLTKEINERKQIEYALRESEQKLRKVIDGLGPNNFVGLLSTKGAVLEANQPALNAAGLHLEDVMNKLVDQTPWFTHSTDVQQQLREAVKLAAKGTPSRYDVQISVANNTLIWIDFSINPYRNEAGKVTYLVASASVIEERKRAEQELRIAAVAFEANEGIAITDVHKIILRSNKSFTKITGYPSQDAIGNAYPIPHPARDNERAYQAIWESLAKKNHWYGEIVNYRKNGESYPEWLNITAVTNPKNEVTNYVIVFDDITLRKAAEEKIEHLAFYDPLTSLPNRRLLQDRLQQSFSASIRHDNHSALLFIDFKMLNDSKGHNIGDLLLIEVSKRLQSCVRKVDTAARLGGDEFIILLGDLGENEEQAATEIKSISGKILDALSQSYLLKGHEYHGSASIGVYLFRRNDKMNVEEALKYADSAMYQAKSAGRNTMRFYDPAMQKILEARVALEADLRRAIAENQFELYYQTQVDHTGQTIGAEALIRWQHPQLGLISPLEFIPLAEETGLILPIGNWVLETACAQLKAWETHAHTKNLQIAVNVSARQFFQPNFATQVRKIMRNHQSKPGLLKLELTESTLLDNVDDTIQKMSALRKVGVRFSIDDFGTGYSSLSYLTQLPLNQLKIDKSFIFSIGLKDSEAIVQTIIGMANNLKMEVIAEGVETEKQYLFLKNNGCLLYQGFLFGKPIPLDEFERNLASKKPKIN
jgi:diguanylate cyclase (GGDEF)-like protein/PAS domain S-box-containing protein